MFKRTIAATAAAAMSLASLAAPARADNDDLARALFGAVALGIIAKSIQDSHSSNTVTIERHYQPAPVHRRYIPAPQAHRPPHSTPPRTVHVTRPSSNVLPAACLRNLRTQNGLRTFVGRPCLQQHNIDTRRLPDRCQRELDFGRRDVDAWNRQCLEVSGYRIR